MKKVSFAILILLLLITIPSVYAKNEKITVYVFTKGKEERSTSAIEYLKKLKDSEIGSYFNYIEYQVWNSSWKENSFYYNLAVEVAKSFDDELLGAPYIVIGNNYKLAAFSEEYEEEIKDEIIKAYLDKDYKDIVKEIEDKIEKSKKYDSVAIIGISILILGIVGALIIFSRKNI